MVIVGLIILVVIAAVLVLVFVGWYVGRDNESEPTVPSRGHGYCPNMGACTDCDVCEED